MKQEERNLPLSLATLIFGSLSIPLAFARHLVSLAVILGLLALVFGFWGDRKQAKHLLRYTGASIKRAQLGFKLAAVGTACALIMWVLWATNSLF